MPRIPSLLRRVALFAAFQAPSTRRKLRRPHRLQLETLEPRRLPSTFLVTTTQDNGPGSLRQAILDANANSGLDTVAFAIGKGGIQTIAPLSALPTITDPIIIDGTTQPGYRGNPIVELTGIQAGNGAHGLHVTAGSSTIRGLVINSFANYPAYGILLENAGDNVILGNYIGTDVTGTVARPNVTGIRITNNSHSNVVGGTAASERNLLSGNHLGGISLFGVSGNLVQGNYVGTDRTGTVVVGNGSGSGIVVSGGSGNSVGGLTPAARNIVLAGVSLSGNAHVVQGNYLGTDVTGIRLLGPGGHITVFNGSSGHLIGGAEVGAGNILTGIRVSGSNVTVQGNYIGVDATGTRALGSCMGIILESGSNNVIGGTTPAARNIISGCGAGGASVLLRGSTTNNRIQGNYIGTDVTGTFAIPNGRDGIAIGECFGGGPSSNIIGGSEPGAGNLISGNEESGIVVCGSYNLVQGNKIGTDITGSRALPNRRIGISIGHFQASGVTGNVIGGTEPGAGNLISGNLLAAIYVDPQSPGTGQHRIQGNKVGTDISGTFAIPNGLDGSGSSALSIGGSGNLIGGSEPGAGNLISGNVYGGVALVSSRLEGNLIGTDVTGTRPLGNGWDGVWAGSFTTISGNRIAYNGHNGILVDTGDYNPIRGNAIWGHGATYRGIRLLNGANNNQAAPQLSWADVHGNRLTVAGTLTSAPNTTYTLEFFANPVCHPSGFGEGKQPLGTVQVATNGEGSAEFEAVLGGWLTGPVRLGRYITATATDPAGNTSEFSRCAVNAGVLLPWLPASPSLLGALREPGFSNRVPLLETESENGRRIVQLAAPAILAAAPDSIRAAPDAAVSMAIGVCRDSSFLDRRSDEGIVDGYWQAFR